MASVNILRLGHFKWLDETSHNRCEASATSTLIQDGKLVIVADTPDLSDESVFISALASRGLSPQEVTHVFVSHYHPDHIGCNHLFPQATFVDGLSTYRGGQFTFWSGERLALSPDIDVLKTPGHTPESASLLVRTKNGAVAIVGDLWWRDVAEETVLAWDKRALVKSRREILRQADWIVPGHAGLFAAPGKKAEKK